MLLAPIRVERLAENAFRLSKLATKDQTKHASARTSQAVTNQTWSGAKV